MPRTYYSISSKIGTSKASIHRQRKRKLINSNVANDPSFLMSNECSLTSTSTGGYTYPVATECSLTSTSTGGYTYPVATECSLTSTSTGGNTYPVATECSLTSTSTSGYTYPVATECSLTSTSTGGYTYPVATECSLTSTSTGGYTYPVATECSLISKNSCIVASDLSKNDNISVTDLVDEISNLVKKHNISHNFTTDLLKVLKTHHCFHSIFPADARTLLGTCKSYPSEIISVQPGFYYHFGIENSIIYCCSDLLDLLDHISLAISIDGLPLTKSTSSSFWPILAYPKPYKDAVFIIGLYWGFEKPSSANDFLNLFIREAISLETTGLKIKNRVLPFKIDHFCCDAPAKSFILQIKGHGGYSSCMKCNCFGDYKNNRVCFPVKRANKRTHLDFISKTDLNHHLDGDETIITKLNINIIQSFPLDYMHLILLGVTKKLLTFMVSKGPRDLRISKTQLVENGKSKFDLICVLITQQQCFTPSEFARKCRSLNELPRFKATELRTFLLYVGPVVLLDNIPEKVYQLFLYLSVATFIFIRPDLGHLKCFAGELMNRFVVRFSKLYGEQFVSHNVHGLLHVLEDYSNFGPLDSYSAFTFENFLYRLKMKIHKPNKPLEQIIRRYYEKSFVHHPQIQCQHPLLKIKHEKGPLVAGVRVVSQHKVCEIEGLMFKTKDKSKADCYFLSEFNDVIEIHNFITLESSEVLIVGYKYHSTHFFIDPINSKELNIFKLLNTVPVLETFCLRDLKKKCVVLENNDIKVSIPLAHSF